MNVPKLRFKEFTDEWKIIKLDELYEFKNGINADRTAYGKGVPLISVTDIINNNFITYNKIRGKIDISNNILMNNSVEYGDILFQRSSETFVEIGTSNIYLDNKMVTFGGFVIRGKKKNNEIPLFINYELKSPNSRKKIIIKGAGAQHYNIGQEDLKQVSIFIPSKEEQTKIANFLSLLDKKIELQTKKIEDLKLYKLSLREKLFNMFETEEKTLSRILVKWNKKNKDNEYSYVESVSNRFGFIAQNEQFDDRNIASSNTNNYYVIEKGVFAYNPSRLNVGSLALKKDDNISLVSPLYECFTTNQNKDFLLEWFQSKEFKKGTFSKFEGGVRNTLNFTNLSTIKISLPNIESQNRIANILNRYNKLVELENKKLYLLQDLKKGFMQKMFV